MRNLFLSITAIFCIVCNLNGQTLDELKLQKSVLEEKLKPIKAEIDPIQSEIDAINAKISTFPGWYKGLFGTVGLNFTGLNNWFANPNPNSNTTALLGSFNFFANKLETKYFWRNSASLNLGRQYLKKDNETQGEWQTTTDVLNATSLYGYKLSEKIAISTLGELRTAVLSSETRFNPVFLDLGVGITYTPQSNLVIVLHPLNYNFIFAKDETQFTSSLGTKFMVDYNSTLYKGIKWRSNLSGFFSYKSADPSLHNGTWTNAFSFTLVKGIGVGIEHAIRINKQEVDATQSYYMVGLTYKI
ncbi:MAG: DUF3078 domain-containing protein [Saprospiraceae bacterium]|nr:DUF3078 domain-containing protein [Saprospiraceae bacterium]